MRFPSGTEYTVYVTSGGCNGFSFDGVFYRRMILLTSIPLAPPNLRFPKGNLHTRFASLRGTKQSR